MLSNLRCLKNPVIAAAALMLAACSSMSNQPGHPERTAQAEVSPPVGDTPQQYRSFENETLYDLLVAEVAGKRNRPDISLGNYLKQAHKTRDPQIAARASRIADFLGANQASLSAALLWVELEPDNPAAREAAAIQLLQAGKFDDTVEQLKALLDINAPVNLKFLLQATLKANKDNQEQILSWLTDLVKQHPENAQLWYTKGSVERTLGHEDQALQDMEKALALKPDYTDAILGKADILLSTGRKEQCLQYLKAKARSYPLNKRVGVSYARALINLKDLKEAQKQFSRLVKTFPRDYDLILSLALVSWENGFNDDAIRYLQQLVDMAQRSDDGHFYLGRIYTFQEKYEKAILHLQQVKMGPLFANAQIQLALILAEQKEYEKARTQLQNARTSSPSDAVNFYITESDLLVRQEQLDEAAKVLEQALSSHPENIPLLYSRAMLREQLGQYEQMKKDLRNILVREPDNVAALNALGYTLADRNEKLEEASILIEKAYKLTPDDPAIIDSMGWIKFRTGDTLAALDYLRKAYQAYRNDEIAAHLGEVLWITGNQQEAIDIWNGALKENPDSKLLHEVMNRLLENAPDKP